ncbi:MAG: hypothetical protein DBX47_05280 [Clostridiales bacterium]|nr:MAG: hypothetical protein DBX47_05280 [Clostridiales bacterium]
MLLPSGRADLLSEASTNIKSNSYLLIFLCVLLYFTSYITRINFNACIAEIINSSVITKTEAGTIGTAMFFFYGTGQLISGFLCDKIRPSKIILIGLFLTMACNSLLPLCTDVVSMSIIWGINGFAQAMFWPPIVKIMSMALSEEYYSKGCLFVSIAAHAATVFVYLAVPACINMLNWKIIFFISAVIAFITAIVWGTSFSKIGKTLSVKHVPTATKYENKPKVSITPILIISGAILLLFAIIVQGFLKDGYTTWMPVYLTEVFSINSSSTIMLNLFLPAVSIACTTLASFLYKKVFAQNEVRASFMYFFIALVLSIVLVFICNISAIGTLIIVSLITGCMHSVNLMLVSLLPARFSFCGKVGAMSGITNACTYIGSSISSFGLAYIAENSGWQSVIIILTGLALMGIIFCLFSYKKWKLFIYKK